MKWLKALEKSNKWTFNSDSFVKILFSKSRTCFTCKMRRPLEEMRAVLTSLGLHCPVKLSGKRLRDFKVFLAWGETLFSDVMNDKKKSASYLPGGMLIPLSEARRETMSTAATHPTQRQTSAGGVQLQGHTETRHHLIARDRLICLSLVLAACPDLSLNNPQVKRKMTSLDSCVHVAAWLQKHD